MSDGFDWTDPEAVRRLMTGLETHLADIHAVVKDMMRPKRKRQLGLREHKRLYRDARLFTIGGGTSEIQQRIVAGQLRREPDWSTTAALT